MSEKGGKKRGEGRSRRHTLTEYFITPHQQHSNTLPPSPTSNPHSHIPAPHAIQPPPFLSFLSSSFSPFFSILPYHIRPSSKSLLRSEAPPTGLKRNDGDGSGGWGRWGGVSLFREAAAARSTEPLCINTPEQMPLRWRRRPPSLIPAAPSGGGGGNPGFVPGSLPPLLPRRHAGQ